MNESASVFSVSIVALPPLSLFGLFVRTTMEKAPQDCSRLWEQVFLPRMPELNPKAHSEFPGDSYGVSVMDMDNADTHAFTYWAAMAVPEGMPLPEGMSRFDLPGGFYATCRVPSLERIGEAYTYLYMGWDTAGAGYELIMPAPCFERYGKDYLSSGALDIFAPVRKLA